MEKITLSKNNVDQNLSRSVEQASCTCYVCGVCLGCIVLPFFVGQFLGISLGLDLDANQNPS